MNKLREIMAYCFCNDNKPNKFDVIKNLTVNNAIGSSWPVYKMIYFKLLSQGNNLECNN